MEKITKADVKLAAIKIHLDGVAFYRAAYERGDDSNAVIEYLTVVEDAIRQIDEIVNGKPAS